MRGSRLGYEVTSQTQAVQSTSTAVICIETIRRKLKIINENAPLGIVVDSGTTLIVRIRDSWFLAAVQAGAYSILHAFIHSL